ncbi:MAG: tyrosine-type recombinase/integrase, partial [Polyangiales bacterium]
MTRSLERLVASTRNERTRKFYQQKAGHLIALLGGETRLESLRPIHVDDYVRARRTHKVTEKGERYVSEHTIHKELATLRAALRMSTRLGVFKGDARTLIPRHSPEYQPREHWLRVEQVFALIESFHVSQGDHAARVAFAVAVGAEWAALDRAERADVTMEFVRVRGTKSAKRDRVVPVVTDWQRLLLEFALRHAAGDKLLFARWPQRAAARSLERAARRAALPHTTWHDLRRTFAQLLRRGGAHIEDLAPTLGHANAKVTAAVYARLDAHGLRDRLVASLGTPVGQSAPNSTQSAHSAQSG